MLSNEQALPFIQFRTRGKADRWRTKVIRHLTLRLMQVSFDGFTGYWIRDPEISSPPETVMYYLHGGGFTAG
jgi:hypothetical protein